MFTVLFHRDYRCFTGGHLKVKHYFDHVNSMAGFRAEVFFAPSSRLDDDNPWRDLPEGVVEHWDPGKADLLFLAGGDWRAVPESKRSRSTKPIINLIQGFEHVNRASPLSAYLRCRALRICVSPELQQAIRGSGQVNGPIWTIPNGMDSSELPRPINPVLQEHQILIAGSKMPQWARRIHRILAGQGIAVETLVRPVSRDEFYYRVRRSRVTLFLPYLQEGFYLPALEGMALGTLVVCPDVLGNRSFCRPESNCLRPEYTLEAIVAAAVRGFRMDQRSRQQMVAAARETAEAHSLEQERRAFHAILEQAFQLWSATD